MAKKDTQMSEMTIEELKEGIASESSKLQQLKFNHAISVLENPMSIRDARRSIAKMKTELQKRINNK